jgi:peptide/nickel transport system ATP-binding protein
MQKKDATNDELPSPFDPPPGCRFHTRCPNARDMCIEVEPDLEGFTTDGQVACHFPL